MAYIILWSIRNVEEKIVNFAEFLSFVVYSLRIDDGDLEQLPTAVYKTLNRFSRDRSVTKSVTIIGLLLSNGVAGTLVKLAVFFTGLELSLPLFSLMDAESIVFCRLKLLVIVDTAVIVWLWLVVAPVAVVPPPKGKNTKNNITSRSEPVYMYKLSYINTHTYAVVEIFRNKYRFRCNRYLFYIHPEHLSNA